MRRRLSQFLRLTHRMAPPQPTIEEATNAPQETFFEFLNTTSDAPIQLYRNAFSQFNARSDDFKETFGKIRAIEWASISDADKNSILELIKSHLENNLHVLLNDIIEAVANYLKLLEHLIATLPSDLIPEQGIFAELLEDIIINDSIPAKKFLTLVIWGMPLATIPEDILTRIMQNLSVDELSTVIALATKQGDRTVRHVMACIANDEDLNTTVAFLTKTHSTNCINTTTPPAVPPRPLETISSITASRDITLWATTVHKAADSVTLNESQQQHFDC